MAVDTDTYMDHFLDGFPTVESRYAAALQLADLSAEQPPDEVHRSWKFLAAHWGDSEESLRDIGDFVWNLASDLPRKGTHLAVVTKGIKAKILAGKLKIEEEEELELTYGRLADRNLGYGYNSKTDPTKEGPIRMGVSPPYLGFGLRLVLADTVRFSIDLVGRYEETKIKRGVPEQIAVYYGVVSLRESLEDYPSNRPIVKREIIYGEEDCEHAINALRSKARAVSDPTDIEPDLDPYGEFLGVDTTKIATLSQQSSPV